jgi:hypothetical protein
MRGLCTCCWSSNILITLNSKKQSRCEQCHDREVAKCISI